jgi:general secretion pathway protein G
MARYIIHGETMKENKKFINNYQVFSEYLPFNKSSMIFTLIELIVVMTIISLLILIAVPRYFHSVEKAKEATLKQSLSVMRIAIDKFYGDNERYPESMAELVTKKYIRAVPIDPITDSAETWVTQAPSLDNSNAVFDIKSGAPGIAKDGTAYAEW